MSEELDALTEERITVPANVLPLVGWLPAGALVLLKIHKCIPGFDDIVRDYLSFLQNQIEGCVVDCLGRPGDGTNPEKNQWEVRQTLTGYRRDALKMRRVHIVAHLDSSIHRVADHEADYAFNVHQGYMDTLLIELGKARRAERVDRSQALIWKQDPAHRN